MRLSVNGTWPKRHIVSVQNLAKYNFSAAFQLFIRIACYSLSNLLNFVLDMMRASCAWLIINALVMYLLSLHILHVQFFFGTFLFVFLHVHFYYAFNPKNVFSLTFVIFLFFSMAIVKLSHLMNCNSRNCLKCVKMRWSAQKCTKCSVIGVEIYKRETTHET